jgi:hypothetical protein
VRFTVNLTLQVDAADRQDLDRFLDDQIIADDRVRGVEMVVMERVPMVDKNNELQHDFVRGVH